MSARSEAPTAANEAAEAAVQAQLERILASETFRQVDRLKRFLRFIVIETVQGRGDQLKEYVIGVQVFDKEPSFDPRADPIVRVQARRLRARLVRYYRDEGRADDLSIELPKGRYSAVFKRRDANAAKRSINSALLNRNAIVVLPFADHSADGSRGYFCNGLRQEIIHALASLESLRVLAWDPAEPAQAADPRQAVNATARGDGRHRQRADVC